MADSIQTIQSNIKQHNYNELTNYALFVGGINSTHDVLAQYDPLITGYGRLFMVRKPTFLYNNIPTQFDKFKHVLEYACTKVDAANDFTLGETDVKGGYIGNGFTLPTPATDSTTSFTVTVYETSGQLVGEVLHTWENGMVDFLTGLAHYNGDSTPHLQANQTAEFVYVATDMTGKQVEFATLLTNCWPKQLKLSHFNYSTTHETVEYDIEFACSSYRSLQISALGQALIDRYQVIGNSLNFYSGINHDNLDDAKLDAGFGYNVKTGMLDTSMTQSEKDASGKPTEMWSTSATSASDYATSS